MSKRGMTLIELMVAMSIFIIVMGLAVGGYVSISRSRILLGIMKNTQQKIRIANEMIIRYTKQAEYVQLADDGSWLELYFDVDDGEVPSAKKFARSLDAPYDLLYSECQDSSPTARSCMDWGTATSLLRGSGTNEDISLVNETNTPKIFVIDGVLPSLLQLNLTVKSEVPGNPALSDSMTIENAIILESVK